ncbi:Kelch repeat-containing protein [Prosthecobacter dejongeii]|uniref:N-acetylneuraminic acid mutarotase n=1 Tax=Prosthecobacter dejongeii TaxID=48465 RepID=A0A7W7YHR3_9BACT|nr:kelch repeat-containing protein [Prosthecobacter dejongeii]MBB5036406.1 N-acetylneuraminic acid mutarotase [Prosthecobacter dejongeii]
MTARPILTISCLLTVLCLLKAKAAEWEKLPRLPEANGGFACGVDHGHVVVAGGTRWLNGEKKWLSSVHLFDPVKKQWKTSALELPSPMAYGVAGQSKMGFVFAGGSTGTKGFDSQGSFAAGHLVLRQGLPKTQPVVLAAGGMMGEKLLFVGGTPDAADLASLTKSVFTLNPDGQIEPLPDYPGLPIGIAASATVGEQLFIFGGAHWDVAKQVVVNTYDAYAFAMETQTWRKLPSFPYAVRGLTAVALHDDLIYLAGGFKNDAEGFTDEAFLYDLQKNEYRPAKPLPYKAMVGLVVCEGQVYCLGGEDKQKSRTDACLRIAVADLIK